MKKCGKRREPTWRWSRVPCGNHNTATQVASGETGEQLEG